MPCDPNTLLHEARCFNCLTEGQRGSIIISLLCQIAANSDVPVDTTRRDESSPSYALQSVVYITPILENQTDSADAGYALQSVTL